MIMASQHIQVGYYGYMMCGVWWLGRQIKNLKAKETRLEYADESVLSKNDWSWLQSSSDT